ncbi:MAG: ABC transporter ATP-binding protein [Paraclostridium sp.]
MKIYLFNNKILLTLVIILSVGVSIGDIVLSVLLKIIIDTAEQKNISNFKFILIMTLIFILSYTTLKYLRGVFQNLYNKKFISNLRLDIFDSIMHSRKNTPEYENKNINISILTNDINMIEKDYIESILTIITSSLSLILAFYLMIKTSLLISIVIISISFLPIAISMLFSKKIAFSKSSYSNELGLFVTKLKEYIMGIDVIKNFNIENKIIYEFNKSNNNLEESKYIYRKIHILSNVLCETISSSIFLIAICIGSYLVIIEKISMGDMILCVQLLNCIVRPLRIIPQKLNNLSSIKLINKKIEDIINNKSIEKVNKPNFCNFNNTIELSNVYFKYDHDYILKDINLSIEKGKKYAIVGQSGSGKSTILKLLQRQYSPTIGEILLDGVSYKELSCENFYSLVSSVQQDIFMFDETIKNNITLFNNYSDNKIKKVINLSGVNSFITNLKNGIESIVGDNGCMLSGGEKQRISIARALIRETPLLLLDEITSSLDSHTSYNIEKTLMNIDNLTCVVVTHKMDESLLKLYDSIIVLKDGEIVEMGTFDNLIDEKGYLYNLYNVYKQSDLVCTNA